MATRISVTVERYGKAHRRWVAVARRVVAGGAVSHFGVALKRVRLGRYRAKAVADRTSCGPGRSPRIRFRVA
jgi:hypothetical protein